MCLSPTKLAGGTRHSVGHSVGMIPTGMRHSVHVGGRTRVRVSLVPHPFLDPSP